MRCGFTGTLGWDAVDDAYISYVYAQNAILGHGLTFNPSERVEGFSNFLWTGDDGAGRWARGWMWDG